MSAIRRTVLAASVLMAMLPAKAAATWSIIVVDRKTGLIGVAGASCTSDVYGIMLLAPGTGAIVAQGIGYPPAMREAVRLMRDSIRPDSILRTITSSAFDSATIERQYGILSVAHGQIQYSGSALRDYRGERSADGVIVQGNLLTGPPVLDRALEAVIKARSAGLQLEDVIMAGLRAGADAGGDSRCGPQRATAAFLVVAKPGDVPNWPYLSLRVVDAMKGGGVNAVELLQSRLDLWKKNGGPRLRITAETVKPDSSGKQ